MRHTAFVLRGIVIAVLVVGSGCNMIKGPARDHECRSNLRSLMVLEFAYHDERGAYSEHPADIGFAPAQGNRSLFLFAKTGQVTRRDGLESPPLSEAVGYGPDTKKRHVTVEELREKIPADVIEQLGLRGTCPACEITIACAANLDDDPDIDLWSISSADREGAPRGTAFRHFSDLGPR